MLSKQITHIPHIENKVLLRRWAPVGRDGQVQQVIEGSRPNKAFGCRAFVALDKLCRNMTSCVTSEDVRFVAGSVHTGDATGSDGGCSTNLCAARLMPS